MKQSIKLILVCIFFIYHESYSQTTTVYTYYISSTIPWNLGYENQYGTTLSGMADGGICIGGNMEFWDQTHIQDWEYGRYFLLKTDSLFNQVWVDSGEFHRDWPNRMRSILVTNNHVIAGVDSTNGTDYFTAIHADSLNGSSSWNKVIQFDAATHPSTIINMIEIDDTIYVSHYGYYPSIAGAQLLMSVLNLNGDTLITKNYSSLFSNSVEMNFQKDQNNNLYLKFSSIQKCYVAKIDRQGNVLEIDSMSTTASLCPFQVLSSERRVVIDNAQRNVLVIFDNEGNRIDSLNLNCYFQSIFSDKMGNVYVVGENNPACVLGDGSHLIKLDSLGKMEWSVLIENVYIYGVEKIDSAFYAVGSYYDLITLAIGLVKISIPSAIPVISTSTFSICAGDSLQLSASSGANYLWSTGETTQSIFVDTSGNYQVFVFDSTGNGMNSMPVTINLDSNHPDLGPDTLICDNTSITLNVDSNYISYLWQDGSTLSSYIVQPSLIDSSYYSCIVVDSNFCTFSDSILVMVDICQLTNQEKINSFNLFPNPNEGIFNVISDEKLVFIRIIDISGKVVFEMEINSFQAQIDLSDYANGLYFLIAETKATTFRKVLLKR